MKARIDRLVIEDLGQECVVYDLETQKAHSLNNSLKWIWNHCDGSRTGDDIVAEFEREFASGDAAAHVQAGLEQLKAANLLTGALPSIQAGPAAMTRRSMVTAGAFAVPILTSVLAPTPAAAKSKDKDDKKDKKKDKR